MLFAVSSAMFAQTPPIEPGVSQELAKWRTAHYSDVRYKLNLTLEKTSPVLKGTMEIRVVVRDAGTQRRGDAGKSEPGAIATGFPTPIILDWRKIRGHEGKSTISNISINGKAAMSAASVTTPPTQSGGHPSLDKEGSKTSGVTYLEQNEHLVFREGVVAGENVIKLDFTSPILTSGSAITRYVDKEDGSEYIYSLFVPSDASTAFPVFDQPDIKARFELYVDAPIGWKVVSNGVPSPLVLEGKTGHIMGVFPKGGYHSFATTQPVSTYVFAFASGPFSEFPEVSVADAFTQLVKEGKKFQVGEDEFVLDDDVRAKTGTHIFVRKSQAAKFTPHAAEVFRLNREGVKYFEQYFDYKFPFPKYDLVLIPEFPFGGMEHAGATFLRESSIIFPQEPTKNDHISRALLMFHEASHQWFGDTVTMRWFDDLWLKEGFATFTAYKALGAIMPEMNSWKVFYERVKQAAYQTDSTKGTTPIYQEIKNLSAAKSAYGNIVYNKAPAFLRQAEFYLGEDKFQTAVRAFLKKHEFGNAGWEDLVKEYEAASKQDLKEWSAAWIKKPGVTTYKIRRVERIGSPVDFHTWVFSDPREVDGSQVRRPMAVQLYSAFVFPAFASTFAPQKDRLIMSNDKEQEILFSMGSNKSWEKYYFPNYQDYGYGIFLLDEKSRDYVLNNIQNEKDPFLRSMMWGALWDSVREGELDPRVFVELVVRNLSTTPSAAAAATPPQTGGERTSVTTPSAPTSSRSGHPSLDKEGSRSEEDESTIATLLGRTGTALNYYIDTVQKPDREGGRNAQRIDHALANARASASRSMQKPDREGGRNTQPIDHALANARVSASRSMQKPDREGGRNTQRIDHALANAQASASEGDLQTRVEDLLIERMRNAGTLGQRITYYRAFLNVAASENARVVLKKLLAADGNLSGSEGAPVQVAPPKGTLPTGRVSALIPLKTKDKFDIVTRLLILNDPEAAKLLADLEKTETGDEAKRYAYAAKAGIATAENKAKYWKDFTENKDISESWIEAAFGPWNSIRHSDLTLPYLQKALQELPNHKRNRKIFFVNGWLGAFIGGQRSPEALAIVNKFLAENPKLDNDLRLKILENADVIERAVRIRGKY